MGDVLHNRLSKILADAGTKSVPPQPSSASQPGPDSSVQIPPGSFATRTARPKKAWIVFACIAAASLIAVAAFIWPGFLSKSLGPNQIPGRTPESARKLLLAVKDLSTFDFELNNNGGHFPSALSVLMRQGTLVEDFLFDVQKDDAESYVVSELLTLIKDKQSSKDRRDLIVISQALFLLGEIGPKSPDGVKALKQMLKHEEKFVSGQASLSLEVVSGERESWSKKLKRRTK